MAWRQKQESISVPTQLQQATPPVAKPPDIAPARVEAPAVVQQWEYFNTHDGRDENLNNLGNKGWELVLNIEGQLYFKRKKVCP